MSDTRTCFFTQPSIFDVRAMSTHYSMSSSNPLISTCTCRSLAIMRVFCIIQRELLDLCWLASRRLAFSLLYRTSDRLFIFDGIFVGLVPGRRLHNVVFRAYLHVRYLIVRDLFVFDATYRCVFVFISSLLDIEMSSRKRVVILVLPRSMHDIKVEFG